MKQLRTIFARYSILIFVAVFVLFVVFSLKWKIFSNHKEAMFVLKKDTNFLNPVQELPPVQSFEKLLGSSLETRRKEMCEEGLFCFKEGQDPWVKLYEQQVREYGDFATRFLFEYYITSLTQVDIDEDGEDETMVFLCGVWGNHCPHKMIVIDNGGIIFSADSQR